MAKLITNSKDHRTINGLVLAKIRTTLGITQVELGKRIGWLLNLERRISDSYISRFESPGAQGDYKHEIKTVLANAIAQALDKNYTD